MPALSSELADRATCDGIGSLLRDIGMKYFDAELRGWNLCKRHGFVVAAGRIFSDKKGRWPDGRLIQTSALLTPRAARDGNVIATLNSFYLLIGPKCDLHEFWRSEAKREPHASERSPVLASTPMPTDE